MKLIKALNNNVALVLDDERKESVVMGRGVAFHVKAGQHVDPSLVEKHFVLNGRSGRKDFDSLLKRITVNDIELASDIIKRGEERLGYRCNDSILLTLSDHLGMMMERARSGIYIGTPLEWDIRLIYPQEYTYATEVVKALRKKTGYDIPKQEAAFIALHFINANFSTSGMQKTMMYTKIIQNILNIAKLFYGREFHENSFHVSRFITHVRYFVRRQMNGEVLEMDLDIARVIAQKCPKDFKCAKKIAGFLNQTYGWEVGEGEILYLALHLNRINQNE
ncbi:MAG: PRD domain-containing protein [Eubacterium sp.]|nr:PRD domain-containing protein [Eubacterium sp.]